MRASPGQSEADPKFTAVLLIPCPTGLNFRLKTVLARYCCLLGREVANTVMRLEMLRTKHDTTWCHGNVELHAAWRPVSVSRQAARGDLA